MTAGEYAVLPSAVWRDVLPTSAHRWAARQPANIRVADCAPVTLESASIPWLTGGRVVAPGRAATTALRRGAGGAMVGTRSGVTGAGRELTFVSSGVSSSHVPPHCAVPQVAFSRSAVLTDLERETSRSRTPPSARGLAVAGIMVYIET